MQILALVFALVLDAFDLGVVNSRRLCQFELTCAILAQFKCVQQRHVHALDNRDSILLVLRLDIPDV